MPVIRRLTSRPAHKDLETGDILWFPEDRSVTNIRGVSKPNLLSPWGHVGMVFFKDEEQEKIRDHPVPKEHPRASPYVVEAIKNYDNPTPPPPRKSGVREISYNDWFQDFDTFWHGRIKKPSARGPVALSPPEQMALVTEALHHLRRPYSGLREPSLNRYTWFSCSKLILVAAYDALGITLDGKPGPRRWRHPWARSLKKSPYIFDVPPPPPPPPPPLP